ncbi:MAG TPA: signal recognition particle protein [Nevskiales bacterium]|nr:signal recognition particle protein [Nevskiales bacterium]
MFQNLGERLTRTLQQLRGQGRITEDNVRDTLREVRMALLEADVALPVVRQFIEDIRGRAVGAEVMQSLTPGQALIKIVHEELVKILGAENAALNLRTQPPAVILMAGLQGSGKTTSTGKLAKLVKEQLHKRVLVSSTDVYRPAALQQLQTLAGQVGVDYFPAGPGQSPVEIASAARQHAKLQQYDLLIVDTAGRLAIDAAMMDEIRALHVALDPVETLFVVDSMSGQDAANTAKAFGDALPLTGVILTKTDGDARGGAALSVRQVTGRPIKYIGVSEKPDGLQAFHPERIASRILGMGDVLSLVEEASRKVDRRQAEQMAGKLARGKGFDLEDLRAQLQQMLEMGGLSKLLEQLPGAGQLPAAAKTQVNDRDLRRQIAIIGSMTPQERRFPELIRASRKRRIAAGSGTQVQDVNRLLRQHEDMQRMMKQFSKGGLGRMLKAMKGRLPPGIPG